MDLETKRKLRLRKNIYQLSVLSLVVVVVWIGFEIYWSYTKAQPTTINANLDPISTNLYIQTAEKLSNREKIDQDQLTQFELLVTQNALRNQALLQVEQVSQTPLSTNSARAATSSATPTN